MQKMTFEDVVPLAKRRKETNKYDYGNIVVFGGSIGFFGAPALSALAAYRTGSGLVSIALEEDDYAFFVNLNPEVMIKRFIDVEEVEKVIKNKDAVLFGPGLEDNLMNERILRLLLNTNIPLVIDATGLTILKRIGFDQRLNHVILTPHIGEARRLLDVEEPQMELKTLTDLGAVVVLKDAVTIIASNEANMASDFGHPGMAKAGSGDVLAGIIASLLGQKYSLLEAAKYGVYLHSIAGQIAVKKCGEHSVVASDIISAISASIASK
ncbi:MAG: NAD(P)H-hydrate dehydratase [Bacilli bacterium]|jgi:NAD(P)H-hydrate epimerase